MQIDEPDPSHALADACLGAMTTRRRSTPFVSSSAAGNSGRERNKTFPSEDAADEGGAEERVERERARMVEVRQNELDQVSDRHDNYVRLPVCHSFCMLSQQSFASALPSLFPFGPILPLLLSCPSMKSC